MSERRIAVVGAGMAGLAAGLRLRELGAVPTIFETGPGPGGMIRTIQRDGWTFELGASGLSATPETHRLLQSLPGLPDPRFPAAGSQRRFLVHAGKVVPVPETPPELLASPLLSIPGRMRFLKEPFVPRGKEDPEETMASFARRRFGEEGAARIFDPRASGTTGGDPEQLLARYTFPVEVEHERRSGSVMKGQLRAGRTARREGRAPQSTMPWSCAGGLAELPRSIASLSGMDLRCGAAVEVIRTVTAHRIEVETSGAAPDTFDGVVCAVPAPALGRIRIEAAGSEALSQVASMPHASLVVVGLGYRRSDVAHRLDGHGLLSASSERRRALGILFTSSVYPGYAPEGHVLLTVTLGGARQPTMVGMDDGELLEVAHQEVQQLLGATARPVISELMRWPAALPLAVAGHAARLAAASGVEATVPQIAFAGTWHDGLMMRDVMQGGMAAAERLLARI